MPAQRVHCQWQPRAAVAVVPPVPAQRGRSGVPGAVRSGGRGQRFAAAKIVRTFFKIPNGGSSLFLQSAATASAAENDFVSQRHLQYSIYYVYYIDRPSLAATRDRHHRRYVASGSRPFIRCTRRSSRTTWLTLTASAAEEYFVSPLHLQHKSMFSYCAASRPGWQRPRRQRRRRQTPPLPNGCGAASPRAPPYYPPCF